MIFITLGTQDKSFKRILKLVDKAIDDGTIKDKVVVQAGYTKYKSKNMEIFDFTSPEKIDEYIKNADLVITHGGVGSILNGLKYNKPIIGVPRLSKYKEHTNDHQLQIINEFFKDGYILYYEDGTDFDKIVKKAYKFKPKKLTSNNKNFVKKLEDYIDKDNHISWWNRYKYIILIIIIIIILILIIK